MDEKLKTARIDKFLKDEMTSRAVFESLRDSFLKNRGSRDVTVLAAERLAVDLLSEAWRDLSKYKSDDDESPAMFKQIGL